MGGVPASTGAGVGEGTAADRPVGASGGVFHPTTSAPPSPDAADAGGSSAAAGAAATDDSGPAIACDWLPG